MVTGEVTVVETLLSAAKEPGPVKGLVLLSRRVNRYTCGARHINDLLIHDLLPTKAIKVLALFLTEVQSNVLTM